ncbi:MAG: PAS domain S-box protein [Anaerolineae bacterium]
MKNLYLEDDPHEAGLARRQAAWPESESRYRALVELSPDAIWLHHDYRFIFINPAGLELLGATSPDQLLGHSIFEVIHPDDQAGVKERIERALELGARTPFVEEKLIRLDGTVMPVELAATPFEEQGRINFQVVCRDITARKQVEEALQQTNTTLQTLINAAPLAIVTIDRNGTVETWNSEAERIFGWSRAEAVGRPIPTIPTEEWPQVRLELAEEFKGVQRTGMELRRRRKDGSFVDVQLWTAPLRDATGIIVANMSILADISERKQAEAQIHYLAGLLDTVSDAIISTEPVPDFKSVSWSRAAELMYGWPAQEAMGRPISKMVQLQWTEAERAEITDAVLHTGQWRGS